MSSIRLFILDAFERHGEMHGHRLRQEAERERVGLWTDISVGALYGAIKRLAADGHLEAVRAERDGQRPERQIYAITDLGRQALAVLRREALADVVLRPDPFDLALTRTGPVDHEMLAESIMARLTTLRRMLAERIDLNLRAGPYLSPLEVHALAHREHVLRSEIAWHEAFLEQLPAMDPGDPDAS